MMVNVQGFKQDLNAALAVTFRDAEDRFELDRNGMVTIAFDGDAEVVLQAVPEHATALLTATICSVARDDIVMLRRALETNLFRITPPGAFLAYDPEKSVLALCQSTGARVAQAESLADCLTDFVTAVATVRSMMLVPAAQAETGMTFISSVSDIIISG